MLEAEIPILVSKITAQHENQLAACQERQQRSDARIRDLESQLEQALQRAEQAEAENMATCYTEMLRLATPGAKAVAVTPRQRVPAPAAGAVAAATIPMISTVEAHRPPPTVSAAPPAEVAIY